MNIIIAIRVNVEKNRQVYEKHGCKIIKNIRDQKTRNSCTLLRTSRVLESDSLGARYTLLFFQGSPVSLFFRIVSYGCLH